MVVAARKGDDRAFGELYERYGRRIFAYVLGMIRDHNRAEDIAQDVFVSALRRMRSTDQAISFKPWIYEIAKNACIDEFRRVQRSREVPIENGSEEEHLVSTEPSPDIWFERDQQLATLNGAFRGLSERQHKVMVLRELEGLSYTEIAARTEMTVPMVESTLLRARRRLSEEYNDIASGRRCQRIHAVIESGGQAAVDGLGLRARRRFARHVAHCQPCARYVHMAGVIAPETGMPAVVKKIAGLLPFPFTRLSFPWDGHGRSGSHWSGILRSARRAAQAVHPAASVGAGQATVAAMAVVVIAGSGAAVGLLLPGRAQGARGTPSVVAARRAADTRTRKAAAARGVGRQRGQAAPVKGSSSHSATAARSGAAHNGAGSSGEAAQQASSAGSGGASTQPPASGTHASGSPLPAPPVHLPHVPPLPVGTHVPPTITRPLKKVVKKVPPLPVPGPLGQAVKSPLGQAVKVP